ncbi:chlorohydrolase [Streptococcus pneumoniae]|nr:chlorohydrolase [Streptococcus pneumoniae]
MKIKEQTRQLAAEAGSKHCFEVADSKHSFEVADRPGSQLKTWF